MINKIKFYSDKSQLYFNLYNPAFCGNLLRICITRYEEVLKNSMPFPLAFLILPLLLNKELRSSLNAKKNLHSWIMENPHLLLNFNTKILELSSITKGSLMFLMQSKVIVLENDANIQIIEYKDPNKISKKEDDLKEYYQKARTIGSWFAEVNDLPTIFSFFGVRP